MDTVPRLPYENGFRQFLQFFPGPERDMGKYLVIPLVFLFATPTIRPARADQEPPTYADSIAPILESHCVSCHQPGQIGPMSLTTYGEVRPWAKAIRAAVSDRKMPPFSAAGPIGRYEDDPRLTDDQIRMISEWVDQGARPGDLENPGPKTREGKLTGWRIGTPDLILKTKPYVPKSGQDDYTLHLLGYEFPEETWIGAVEVRHSNFGLVHHSTVNLYGPASWMKQKIERKHLDHLSGVKNSTRFVGEQIGGWLPGSLPRMRPAGDVKSVPKGAIVVLNNHYAPVELSAEPIESEVGFYFFTGEIREIRGASTSKSTGPFLLAPNEKSYKQTFEEVLPENVLIDSYGIHMHLRGASSRITLVMPDGTQREIFDIPRYSFHWQRTYRLVEPIPAPKGSKLIHESAWDNSAGNPDNPDPNQEVHYGFGSADEMWISSVSYRLERERERPIVVSHGHRISEESVTVASE